MAVQKKKILVVDDDEHVLNFMVRMLVTKGHKVTGASGAEEALKRYSESYDLVISDVTMPGKIGLWLLNQIREKSPEVKFILMSANADFENLQPLEKCEPTQFIRKPFKIEEILKKINA